jgi:hypothetical protein
MKDHSARVDDTPQPRLGGGTQAGGDPQHSLGRVHFIAFSLCSNLLAKRIHDSPAPVLFD